MQTCANACKNLLRSHWWQKTDGLDENSAVASPEVSSVKQAVMALEPKYRAVVYLYYYEGYSTAEIGALLKISQSVVSTRLFRARQALKTVLED